MQPTKKWMFTKRDLKLWIRIRMSSLSTGQNYWQAVPWQWQVCHLFTQNDLDPCLRRDSAPSYIGKFSSHAPNYQKANRQSTDSIDPSYSQNTVCCVHFGKLMVENPLVICWWVSVRKGWLSTSWFPSTNALWSSSWQQRQPRQSHGTVELSTVFHTPVPCCCLPTNSKDQISKFRWHQREAV